MFRIKVCGVTSIEDACHAARCGADAIGLNFYRGSLRCISPEQAADIASAMPAGVVKVGVFVNAAPEDIRSLVETVRLDAVQLHGDEGADELAALAGIPVVCAYRHGPGRLATLDKLLLECRRAGRLPDAILVDAHRSDAYGGTGAAVDWSQLAEVRERVGALPLILAGGLTPENVATAIRASNPSAVDTASGVEAEPGRKDPVLVERFVTAARAAWDLDR